MKIAVYDKVNKSRLLGYLAIVDMPKSCRYDVALHDGMSSADLRNACLMPSSPFNPMRSVERLCFDIDVRSHNNSKQIDAATREITTIERKCFLTDVPLEKLMKLDRFTLPEETNFEATERRRTTAFR